VAGRGNERGGVERAGRAAGRHGEGRAGAESGGESTNHRAESCSIHRYRYCGFSEGLDLGLFEPPS